MVLTDGCNAVYGCFEAWLPARQKSEDVSVEATHALWTEMQSKCTALVAGIYHTLLWISMPLLCISYKVRMRLMKISVVCNFSEPEDWFFSALVRLGGYESASAYVAALVDGHLRSHRDFRVCSNPACCLPCWPSPQYPQGGRKPFDDPAPVLQVARFCGHCGTKVKDDEG